MAAAVAQGGGPQPPTCVCSDSHICWDDLLCGLDAYRFLGASEVEGRGEADIDSINTTCNKQDYLLYIAY